VVAVSLGDISDDFVLSYPGPAGTITVTLDGVFAQRPVDISSPSAPVVVSFMLSQRRCAAEPTPGCAAVAVLQRIDANTFLVLLEEDQEGPIDDLVLRVQRTGSTAPGPPTGAPGSPTLVANQVTANPVSLSWVPGPGGAPASYTVVAGTSPGGTNVGTFPVGAAQVISGIAPVGVPLFVRVIASNALGSAVSNEVTFTVGSACSVPATPQVVSGGVAGGVASLTWNAVANATSYIVQAGSAPGGVNVFSGNVGNATTVGAPVPAGFVAFARVIAVNQCGVSSPSQDFLVR
jgi:hypothetical protein